MSTNNTGGNESNGIDHTDEGTLRQLYLEERMSIIDMAKMSDVTPRAIRYWMDKYGIETRDCHRQQEIESSREPAPLFTGSYGYQLMSLPKSGPVKVSRMVAIAEYGLENVAENHVHHKNGVKWLDYPDNIEVLGPGEHLEKHQTGEDNNRAKLNEQDVKEILRLLRDTQMSQREIAEMYGVDQTTISDIHLGRNWSWVEIEP